MRASTRWFGLAAGAFGAAALGLAWGGWTRSFSGRSVSPWRSAPLLSWAIVLVAAGGALAALVAVLPARRPALPVAAAGAAAAVAGLALWARQWWLVQPPPTGDISPITVAIRDLPSATDSRPVDLTWLGYVGGVLMLAVAVCALGTLSRVGRS